MFFWTKKTSLFFEVKQLSKMISYINWSQFIFGIIINIFISASIGVVISSYAKTPMFALAIGMLILIPGGFLSGQYFYLGLVLKDK